MRPSEVLQMHREEIRHIVETKHARNPRVFGSIIHGDDIEGSDLDILVDPTPETSMFDIGEIRYQLRKLLGVPVDVLTPRALHARLRDQVLSEAQPV
jgi:uncharacterized protein